MTITLDAAGLPASKPIALPCYRICALLDGGFEEPRGAAAAVAVHDTFMASFQNDIRFSLTQSRTSKSAKVVKARPAKLTELRNALESGWKGSLKDLRGVRLYGSDDNPLAAPFLPLLSIGRTASFDLLQIELSVPADMPGLAGFAKSIHEILIASPLRYGIQGFGFDKSGVNGLQDRYLPLAHKRFRTALMGDFDKGFQFLLFARPALKQRWGDIALGIPDMGWRTYIHKDYTADLGETDAAEKAGMLLDEHGDCICVTAGRKPIWGDLNALEDISAYTATFNWLRPAFGDQRFIMGALWGNRRPEEKEASESYINRLAKGATP